MAEKFFEEQVEQIIEVINEDRDEKIVLSKEDMKDIVDSLLDNDGLWQEIDHGIRETIYFVTGEEI